MKQENRNWINIYNINIYGMHGVTDAVGWFPINSHLTYMDTIIHIKGIVKKSEYILKL